MCVIFSYAGSLEEFKDLTAKKAEEVASRDALLQCCLINTVAAKSSIDREAELNSRQVDSIRRAEGRYKCVLNSRISQYNADVLVVKSPVILHAITSAMKELPVGVISSPEIAAAADQTARLQHQRMVALNSGHTELIRAQKQLYVVSAPDVADAPKPVFQLPAPDGCRSSSSVLCPGCSSQK